MIKTQIFATPALESDCDLSFDELLTLLLPGRRKRVLSFHHQNDRLRALWGELLSRSIIREHLGEDYQNQQYGVNECGKPFLESEQSFHFNVTHCGDWVFSIVSPHNCGIDCEKIKPVNLKIGRRYFSSEEADYIESCPKKEQPRAFLKIWTLKESYLKMLGIGLTKGMKFFTIIPDHEKGFLCKNLEQAPYVQCFHWQKDYVLSAVAANGENIPVPVIRGQNQVLSILHPPRRNLL